MKMFFICIYTKSMYDILSYNTLFQLSEYILTIYTHTYKKQNNVQVLGISNNVDLIRGNQ